MVVIPLFKSLYLNSETKLVIKIPLGALSAPNQIHKLAKIKLLMSSK